MFTGEHDTIHETRAIARAVRPLGGRIVSLDVASHRNPLLVCGPRLRPRELRRRLRADHPELARKLGRGSLTARTVYTPPKGGRKAVDSTSDGGSE